MNRYPLWKYALVVVVFAAAALYALPNLFGESPALQISGTRGAEVTALTEEQVVAALDRHGIAYHSVERDERQLMLRFSDTDAQLRAADAAREALGHDYVVALNLAPNTPAWLSALGGQPMYLGLDLRGGVHFLLQVDMEAALNQALERYAGEFRTVLREGRIRYQTINHSHGEIRILFRDAEEFARARELLRREYRNMEYSDREQDDNRIIVVRLDENEAREIQRFAIQQNITTLRNRVNELGVAEPLIQQQGTDRIVVQLPGVQDTARAKEILGATATLEFRMAVGSRDEWDEAAATGRIPVNAALYRQTDGSPVLLRRQLIITGDQVTDASSGFEQDSGRPAVFVRLDGRGARAMSETTRENIGRPMAVVFIENRPETVVDADGTARSRTRTVEEVISVATIQGHFSARFQITGVGTSEQARDLALLLRAGALAAPIEIIEERTVGPSMGQDNIDQGLRSVILGFILVLAFMAFWYRGFGMVANVALAMNLVIIVAVLSMLQATLTLPGIAGILLTVGMAVDANVLIFERIREELRNGNSPQSSIHAGYEKALSTIADANITTLIAALVLFMFGTGPIKGFAITLSIGLATSMFTAIVGTRAIVNYAWGGKRLNKLSI